MSLPQLHLKAVLLLSVGLRVCVCVMDEMANKGQRASQPASQPASQEGRGSWWITIRKGKSTLRFPRQHFLPGLFVQRNPKAAFNKRPGSASAGPQPGTTHRAGRLTMRMHCMCRSLYEICSNDALYVCYMCAKGVFVCRVSSISGLWLVYISTIFFNNLSLK